MHVSRGSMSTAFQVLRHADMVELADTLDLGSSARACRFKSCYPHQILYHLLINLRFDIGGIFLPEGDKYL